MIDGCTAWSERGLAPPTIVSEATAAYLDSEDALAAWIDEYAERKPEAWEKSSDLFASWSEWAGKSGEFVGSQRMFAQKLETHNIAFERKNKARGFRGLRLLKLAFDSP